MANGGGYGGLFELLCCLWLFTAATQPRRERVYYVQQPAMGADASGDNTRASAHALATGGDLPMLACAHMTRDTEAGTERV